MKYFKLYVDGTNDFFTYMDEREEFKIGDRVAVNFRNRERGAIIIKEEVEDNFLFKVLPIKRKLENEISFDKKYIDLLLWIKDYYMCSFQQVFLAALPGNIKIQYHEFYQLSEEIYDVKCLNDTIIDYFHDKEKVTKPTLRKYFSNKDINFFLEKNILNLSDKNKISFNFKRDINSLNLKKDEIALYKNLKIYFSEKLKISKKHLEDKFSKKEIDKAIKEKSINLLKVIKSRSLNEQETEKQEIVENITLNKDQERAYDEIANSKDLYYLIKGITGSGKTEIYIKLIREALKNGHGSIFLVPEISLTPQMVNRFKKEFKDGIAILHSKLTNKEREEEWLSINSGDKKIVLGVRSAIFAPVKNLKYIIIDEEHEASYKQDTNPRYNAKLVALRRGFIENCKVVLGSATPSIENYFYSQMKNFKLISLGKRYNNAVLPEIEIVDMKEETDNFFSNTLLKNIRETILRGEQVILLLNRKGYSTMIQCKDCGHIEECEHCSIKLSYYNSTNKLKCNYCGREKNFNGVCSSCGSKNLNFGGKGTEQVEERLKEYFSVPIIRVDSESAKEKNFYKKTYFDFLDKKYDIMIGTQMIAKGLHFPNVTLVGVINSDVILSFPDFRATEKTYQLITQVAGRAGRGDKKGKVIIQTYQPENYVMEKIQNNDYEGFYREEIESRKLLEYPPFSKIINIGISSKDENILNEVAKDLYNKIYKNYVEVFGPNKSLVYKVKDRYRQNIFIKGSKKNITIFKNELKVILNDFNSKNCRIIIDVDPINLI
ncbi:primosomal protein N' [Fusobacterium sp. MFO224]|uniref:replication restart helicase PriA n=1 Tax=Fusobacterium sp. MFO224 TaxID=3378070 RepID=UPI0038537CD9